MNYSKKSIGVGQEIRNYLIDTHNEELKIDTHNEELKILTPKSTEVLCWIFQTSYKNILIQREEFYQNNCNPAERRQLMISVNILNR